jgi:N-methylhydantoinase A
LLRNAGIEIDQHRVTGTLAVTPVPFPARELAGTDPAAAHTGSRSAYFEAEGYVATELYDGAGLAAGNVVEGPAIIQRMGDSVVVPPGCSATVDARMALQILALGAGVTRAVEMSQNTTSGA